MDVLTAKMIMALGVCAAVATTVWITKDGDYLWGLLALLLV